MFLVHITHMKQVTEQPFKPAPFHDVVLNHKLQVAEVFQILPSFPVPVAKRINSASTLSGDAQTHSMFRFSFL